MTQESQKNNTVMIAVAIIGVIGTIIATTIGVIGNYNIEKLRQDTELTRIASMSTTAQVEITQVSLTSTISSPTDTQVTILPSTTSLPTIITIDNLNRLEILTWLKVPRGTLSTVDRLDVIYRQSRSSSIITIRNYSLLPQYTLDDYGYLLINGQSFNYPIDKDINNLFDKRFGELSRLENFDFVIPAYRNYPFCGFFIQSNIGDGILNDDWEHTQRFIYSGDITSEIKIDNASWVDIKDCGNILIDDWAKSNAQNSAASATTDSVYYWDGLSNSWVQLK